MIKSLLISFLLLLSICNNQVIGVEPSHGMLDYRAIYEDVTYISWSKSNSGYWTNYTNYSVYNDFDWMVSRSNQPDYYGYYYYHIWFYSQSFYWNGYNKKFTSTNIKDIKLYVNNYLTVIHSNGLGITFMNEYKATSLTFKSKLPNAKINIVWGKMSAK